MQEKGGTNLTNLRWDELDGAGPIDNRPCNDKLHHFVKKNVTQDMWHMVGGKLSLKISSPQLLRFGVDSVLKILNKRMTQL